MPFVDDSLDALDQKLLNPVIVRRIRNPDSSDLEAALELYKKRIPPDEQFEAGDIVRWLREDQNNSKNAVRTALDCFLVAKLRKKVCGFVLFHYYPPSSLAFFAYMVVNSNPGIPANGVSTALCRRIASIFTRDRQFRACRGFVLEVDDPRLQPTKKKRDECLAGVQRFCYLAEMQGYTLRAVDFPYMQPRLSHDDAGSPEKRMLLMSARLRGGIITSDVARQEVVEILNFAYCTVYPESYSANEDENQAYRKYCASLRDREIGTLPENVTTVSVSRLVNHTNRISQALHEVHELSIQ